MRLRTRIVTLAVVPLVVALLLVAAAVHHQERDLAARERALVEHSLLAQRRSELRSYVELAVSTVRPLYDTGRDDAQTRDEALRRLAALDYGNDGYFFVYDMQGRSLMHSRQHELQGQNLWELRDSRGRATIQDLIGQAQNGAGAGFVEYEWRKPSSAQLAPKLGYVTSLPRWNWMLGTGLYLDDVETAMQTLQRQVSDNVTTTMLWIAAIAAGCIGVVSAGGLLLNLSEHRVAEAKLRLLARQVVQSQEDERGHLARELHDGISQTLVSAKLLIESAVDSLERTQQQPAPPAMAKALLRLNDSLSEVRRISHRLRPALLDTLGLPAALEHLGTEFGEAGSPQVEVRIEGPRTELPEEVNTALFRVAQEALTNVHKHAQARHVRLSLAFHRAHVQLEVRDDGIGFDEVALNLDPRRGIGLRNMRERMGAIGCTLDVQSDNGGTRIIAMAPVTIVRIA